MYVKVKVISDIFHLQVHSYIFIQLQDIRTQINVDSLPISFLDLVGVSDKYVLLGVIRYINSRLMSESSIGQLGIGHYTLICRRNNVWTEFNDLRGRTQRTLKSLKDKRINIEFLIYTKVPKHK